MDMQTVKLMLSPQTGVLAYTINYTESKLNLKCENIRDYLWESEYEDKKVQLLQTVKAVSDGFYRITRSFTNKSSKEESFVFFTEVIVSEPAYFTLIPCVLYNENRFGSGGEPKGLKHDGKPWCFAYSRSGLPSASISEGEKLCVGLFADTDSRSSLYSASSLYKTEHGRVHRILYPEQELPVAYTNRDGYSPAITGSITLKPNESFTASCYLSLSRPKSKNFGLMNVYNHAASVLDLSSQTTLTNGELWERGLSYAKDWLLQNTDDHSLFTIGYHPDESGTHLVPRYGYEIGWCGQNATYARAFINDNLRHGGSPKHLDIGIDVIDTWVRKNRFSSGLVGSHFPDDLKLPIKDTTDTCNMGWAGWQVLKAYKEVQSAGIVKPEWLSYGVSLCDFFVSHYSEEYAFGKVWNANGSIADESGTVGAYICLALLEAFVVTGREEYRDTAARALRLYDERDLQQFTCTAGALDTCCVDKETCCPLLSAANTLYEMTGEEDYLSIARRAAYYLLSWTYLYDVDYDKDSDIKTLGFRTKGATSVSAQHHHLDPWGGIICYEFERFYKATGEDMWHKMAKIMWDNCMLCIAGLNMSHKGIDYPYGAQGEATFHTNWVFSGDYMGKKGSINQWFVAWPNALRMYTLMEDEHFLE